MPRVKSQQQGQRQQRPPQALSHHAPALGDALGAALLDAAADVRTAARAAFGAFESRFPALAARQRDKLPPAARRLLGNSPPGTGAGRPPKTARAGAKTGTARARPWRARGPPPAAAPAGTLGEKGPKSADETVGQGFEFEVQVYAAKRPDKSPSAERKSPSAPTGVDVQAVPPRPLSERMNLV